MTAEEVVAEVSLACSSSQLVETLEWFEDNLGFRMEQIFPADSPRIVVMSGHGVRIRLEPPSEGVGAGRCGQPHGDQLVCCGSDPTSFI